MNIPLLIIIAYIALLFAISGYARTRSQGNADNYVRAGKQLTAPLIFVSMVGLVIGGASTIGISEQAFKVGLSAGWYNVGWGVGSIIMGWFLIRFMRARRDFTTLPELLNRYYDRKGSFAAIITQLIICIVATSLQYIAGGSILHTILPNVFTTLQSGIITSGVVFVAITFIGGLWSASLSNILNVALIYGGLIIATIATISGQGGMAPIVARLPETGPWLDPVAGIGWTGVATFLAVGMAMNLGLQSVTQIAMSGKTTEGTCKGFIWAGIFIIPIGFVSALMGVVAKSAFPSSPATLALPQTIMTLDPWLAGITLAALWAADVSTACNLLLGSSTLVSQDIYKRFINPDVSPESYVWINKGAVLAMGALTCTMSMYMTGILNTLIFGLSLCAAFGVILLFTLFAPQLCRRTSAFWTFTVAVVLAIAWQYVPAVRILPHVVFAEWIACTVTFLCVYLVDSQAIEVDEADSFAVGSGD